MKNFLQEIKDRKISKWLSIYISTSITIIGVDRLLSLRYNWPNFIFDVPLITLLFGLASVILVAWFHGKEESQKLKKKEIIFHSIIIIVWLSVLLTKIDYGVEVKENTNKKIVAVLPFANFNETKETEFIADGITDDILNQISKISALKVISRTSVMKYKNSDENISNISKELGAGTILEGSVRTFDNKIRIVAQLIDANKDVHMWSATYDRELQDIFDIQSDIAERIAAALHAKLLPPEIEKIRKKPTENLDAYTYYLEGKHHYYNYTEKENEEAIKFFKKALEIDPKYALAIAGLSDAYGQKVAKYWASENWIDSSIVLSKKALKINPNLAEGYKTLASGYQAKGEIELALINYEKAIKLNPNYWSAILNYGQLKTFLGHHDEALYWLRRANELTPNDIFGNVSVAMVYKNLNCDSSAIYWAKKAVSLDSSNKFSNYYLGENYLSTGDFKNAEKYFKKTVELDSDFVFGWFLGGRLETVKGNNKLAKEYRDKFMKISEYAPEWFYAYNLLQLGMQDSAKKILDEELQDYTAYFDTTYYPQVSDYIAFSEIYALRKEKDNAFSWWKKAINNGFTEISRVRNFPYFNNLKNDPRYNKTLDYMETKIDSFKLEAKSKYPEYFDCK